MQLINFFILIGILVLKLKYPSFISLARSRDAVSLQ